MLGNFTTKHPVCRTGLSSMVSSHATEALVLALAASTPTVAVEEDDVNPGAESEGVEEVLVGRIGAA